MGLVVLGTLLIDSAAKIFARVIDVVPEEAQARSSLAESPAPEQVPTARARGTTSAWPDNLAPVWKLFLDPGASERVTGARARRPARETTASPGGSVV